MFSPIKIIELIVILVIVVILFGGRGKLSSILADIGRGLKNFRNEISDKSNSKNETSDKDNSKN